jgi:hypothetical protein
VTQKEPVTLAAHLNLFNGTWSVASVNRSFEIAPLVQSHPHDLDPWCTGPFDNQVTFLRHRIAGLLQRGSDRLWGRQQKAQLFTIDYFFEEDEASLEVITSVAHHFCTWMLKPPVVCLRLDADGALNCIASNTSHDEFSDIASALQEIRTQADQPGLWELAPPSSGQ